MKNIFTILSAFLLATVFLAGAPTKSQANSSAEPETYVIKWQIVHTPVEYFKRTATKFSDLLDEKTNGRIKVEIIEKLGYEKDESEYHTDSIGSLHRQVGTDRVITGEMEMAQVYTTGLRGLNPDFTALHVPMLFKDDEHVERVLEGEVGQQLLASLDESHDLVGLGFTYSGGFLNVAARSNGREINSFEDAIGKRHRSFSSDVYMETSSSLGFNVMPAATFNDSGERISYADAYDKNIVDSSDFTPSDAEDAFVHPKNPADISIETKHNILLTTLIMNKEFFKNLPEDLQQAVREAAFETARAERQHVIDDGKAINDKLLSEGKKVITLSEEERQELEKRLQPAISKITEKTDPALVEKIRQQAH